MMDLSNQTVLVIDQGLYVHIAEKLAESFGRVLYYCNGWRSAFPVSERFNIGAGIDGIERIANPWEYVDGADLIVFPDTISPASRITCAVRASGCGGRDTPKYWNCIATSSRQ
ncbi:MAG TPA: hypothetical protein VGY99_15430 [Candidatus Binataceae bacterium]|jgi:hypothetical protein|nr:hypothetical protein [Candidatus Binataceae bacterium]